MINKTYVDNLGGKHKVIKVDGNIAFMEDGNRIAVERLLDTVYFREQNQTFSVNENLKQSSNILDSTNRYNYLFNDLTKSLNNLNIDDMNYSDSSPKIVMDNNVVENRNAKQNYNEQIAQSQIVDENEAANIRKDLLERTIREQNELDSRMKNQNNILSSYIDEEDLTNMPKNTYQIKNDIDTQNPHFGVQNTNNEITRYIEPKIDPTKTVFSGLKKTDKFNISIKIEEMIPSKTFIKMWSESSDISLVDYLADEMYNKLMGNPHVIKEQIIEKLNALTKTTKKKENSDIENISVLDETK